MKKEKNLEAWAWEFLRRNSAYRSSFAKVNCLTSFQQEQLQYAANNGPMPPPDEEFMTLSAAEQKVNRASDKALAKKLRLEWSEPLYDAKNVRLSLPAELFTVDGRKSEVPGETLGEFLERLGLTKKLLSNWSYSVDKSFDLRFFFLTHWKDPSRSSVGKSPFDHRNEYAFGLTDWLPWEDLHEAKKRAIEYETVREMASPHFSSEYTDVLPSRSFGIRPKRLPIQRAGLGLIQGTSGGHFLPNLGSSHLELSHYTDAAIKFDLAIPLGPQLRLAEAVLKRQQKKLRAEGFCFNFRVGNDRGMFPKYLEVLDLEQQGKSALEMALNDKSIERRRNPSRAARKGQEEIYFRHGRKISPGELTSSVRKLLERARELRDHGYVGLIHAEPSNRQHKK